MLADVQKVEGLREDAMKERFSSMEKTLRDVHRGVQIVRDKQVDTSCAAATVSKGKTVTRTPFCRAMHVL